MEQVFFGALAMSRTTSTRLDDTLLQSAANGLLGSSSPSSSPLLARVVMRIRRCWESRPTDCPFGAAAFSRQQGASQAGSGQNGGANVGELPRRGQIWTAEMELLALPEGDRQPISMVDGSPAVPNI